MSMISKLGTLSSTHECVTCHMWRKTVPKAFLSARNLLFFCGSISVLVHILVKCQRNHKKLLARCAWFARDLLKSTTGDTCAINTNECSSNPCQNQGICTDEVNSFKCTCSAGYTGKTCETRLCDVSTSVVRSQFNECPNNMPSIPLTYFRKEFGVPLFCDRDSMFTSGFPFLL